MSFVVCSAYILAYDRHGNDLGPTRVKLYVRRKMETDRITIRLPKIYLRQIDLFLRAGEFTTRSEFIRHAVNEFIKNYANRIIEKADRLKKVQELEAAVETLEPYMKK
jgi:Arc/MetJ-type ribon-helix-helix transcriptional regulator